MGIAAGAVVGIEYLAAEDLEETVDGSTADAAVAVVVAAAVDIGRIAVVVSVKDLEAAAAAGSWPGGSSDRSAAGRPDIRWGLDCAEWEVGSSDRRVVEEVEVEFLAAAVVAVVIAEVVVLVGVAVVGGDLVVAQGCNGLPRLGSGSHHRYLRCLL